MVKVLSCLNTSTAYWSATLGKPSQMKALRLKVSPRASVDDDELRTGRVSGALGAASTMLSSSGLCVSYPGAIFCLGGVAVGRRVDGSTPFRGCRFLPLSSS